MGYKIFIYIGLGGALGSLLRYFVGLGLNQSYGWGTFWVNMIGALLMGILMGLFYKHSVPEELVWFLAVGFCGGFTTFSTFAYEGIRLVEEKKIVYFLFHFFIYPLLGFAFCWLGYSLCKK